MRVQQIMSKAVFACRRGDNVERATQIMWEKDVGFVPIVDEARRVLGVLTDRDVCMAAYTQGKRLAEIGIEPIMSKNVVTIRSEETTGRAEQLMREAQIRRLPVVDREGALVGLVTQNDLVREAVRERGTSRPELSVDEVAVTLAGIGRPRRVSTLPAE
jgi:CBS domain-containing protein